MANANLTQWRGWERHRIGVLNCRYRVYGTHTGAHAAGSHLDRIARDGLAEVLDEHLERTLGDDRRVIVLQRVVTRTVLPLSSERTDGELADRWGRSLAETIRRRIDSGPSRDFVAFADQADFIARFVVDLLAGRAWDQWYYAVFANVRGCSPGEALRHLLGGSGELASLVFARLLSLGALDSLITTLSLADQFSICTVLAGGKIVLRQSADSLRTIDDHLPEPVLTVVANALAEALAELGIPLDLGQVQALIGELQRQRLAEKFFTAVDAASTSRGSLQERRTALLNKLRDIPIEDLPALREVINLAQARELPDVPIPTGLRPFFVVATNLIETVGEWKSREEEFESIFIDFAGRMAAMPVDWQDARSLAQAVFVAVEALADHGALEKVRSSRAGDAKTALHRAVRSLEWLDTRWLWDAISPLLLGDAVSEQKTDPPSVSQNDLTEPGSRRARASVVGSDRRVSSDNRPSLDDDGPSRSPTVDHERKTPNAPGFEELQSSLASKGLPPPADDPGQQGRARQTPAEGVAPFDVFEQKVDGATTRRDGAPSEIRPDAVSPPDHPTESELASRTSRAESGIDPGTEPGTISEHAPSRTTTSSRHEDSDGDANAGRSPRGKEPTSVGKGEAGGFGDGMPRQSELPRRTAVSTRQEHPNGDAITVPPHGAEPTSASEEATHGFDDGVPMEPALPSRVPRFGTTPRQRRLLNDLARAVESAALDPTAPAAPANRMRLYAALIGESRAWAGDALATDFIHGLLCGWEALRVAPNPTRLLRHLGEGHADKALQEIPSRPRGKAKAALDLLAALGHSAVDTLRVIASSPERSARPADRPWPNPARGRGGPDMERGLPVLRRPSRALAGSPASWRRGGDALERIDSACTGVALMIRAVLDAGLPAIAGRLTAEAAGAPAEVSAWNAALFLRLAGMAPSVDDSLDPGLRFLAGLPEEANLDDVARAWLPTSAATATRVQAQFLNVLVRQRLLKRDRMNVYRRDDGTGSILYGSAPELHLGPLAVRLDADPDIGALLAQWNEAWLQARGTEPTWIVPSDIIADRNRGAGHLAIAAADEDQAIADEYEAGGRRLDSVLAVLAGGELGHPDADLALTVLVAGLTHLWARWLRGFVESSPGYLIDGLIRRPGTVLISERRIEVHLPSRPLDVVLRLAGYADALEKVPWLGERSLAFRLGDGT